MKRNILLTLMEYYAAGTNFGANYAGTDTDQNVRTLVRNLPDSPIDTTHVRYDHLMESLRGCKNATGIMIEATTYLDTSLQMLMYWEALKTYTYTYRVLLDLGEMSRTKRLFPLK